MMQKRNHYLYRASILMLVGLLYACTSRTDEAVLEGYVLDEDGSPFSGASVRIQGMSRQTTTDSQGYFTLTAIELDNPVTISAWAEGYYCAKSALMMPPARDITLSMRLVQTNDNSGYQWVPPSGETSCYSCKPGVTQVWMENDAHGRSATNIRFLTMYNGTDVNGNQSPLTRYGNNRDYGRFPLRPDFSKPYFGPGYKLDFPNTAGNCATCHIPGAAVDDPYGIDPNTVTGVNLFGIHCDYCHKVADVILDKETSLPYTNMPGVLSQDIRRPFTEDPDRFQVFFGSFDDDNVPEEDTFLPLINESSWCAPCHYGIFWDTLVYNSYGEWLESPYSDKVAGKTCQQCHMPAPTMLQGEPITNVAPASVGIERDPSTIHAHTFPGGGNEAMLQNAVSMKLEAKGDGNQINVVVTLLNDQTGHHVPSDSPLRQMILLVQAVGTDGEVLELLAGPTVPEWGGVGDPEQGYYFGLPGKGYAKILAEMWTGISPSGAYWNPTRIVSDNRIAAFATDSTSYNFGMPGDGEAKIEVTLLYRRAFKTLMDKKGWDVPDIVMEKETLLLRMP